jgi:hypothetical protein
MTIDIRAEVDAVQQIGAVPKILDVADRMTGMGFVAIARVTSSQWGVLCGSRQHQLRPQGRRRAEGRNHHLQRDTLPLRSRSAVTPTAPRRFVTSCAAALSIRAVHVMMPIEGEHGHGHSHGHKHGRT